MLFEKTEVYVEEQKKKKKVSNVMVEQCIFCLPFLLYK